MKIKEIAWNYGGYIIVLAIVMCIAIIIPVINNPTREIEKQLEKDTEQAEAQNTEKNTNDLYNDEGVGEDVYIVDQDRDSLSVFAQPDQNSDIKGEIPSRAVIYLKEYFQDDSGEYWGFYEKTDGWIPISGCKDIDDDIENYVYILDDGKDDKYHHDTWCSAMGDDFWDYYIYAVSQKEAEDLGKKECKECLR